MRVLRAVPPPPRPAPSPHSPGRRQSVSNLNCVRHGGRFGAGGSLGRRVAGWGGRQPGGLSRCVRRRGGAAAGACEVGYRATPGPARRRPFEGARGLRRHGQAPWHESWYGSRGNRLFSKTVAIDSNRSQLTVPDDAPWHESPCQGPSDRTQSGGLGRTLARDQATACLRAACLES